MTEIARLNDTLSDRYAIDREIGAGGMAVVYLADDLKHRRKVALKVLRRELAAVIGADRFLREIETTAKLQHPHILPLHDSGVIDGTAFYVMPFVEGESLRARLNRETQLPVEEAVRIAREVASALDYAHRHGVIHRDIKPENILLHDGQALVADFGIALAVSSAGAGTRMTETGMSLGTPHYMSPEQAMGQREITARSDVYAVGCVLYEMLLGEPPFTGPSAQAIIARVVTEEPRSLAAQRKSIPVYVEATVRRALEKLPADRFASAAEFSAALTGAGYTGSAPLAVANMPRATSGPVWHRDRRTIALVAGAAALVVATALLARSNARPAVANVIRMIDTPPDSIAGLTHQYRLRGPPAVSHDGSVIAYAVSRGDTSEIFVRALDQFSHRTVPGGGRYPFFSPDGDWIGFVRGFEIWKVQLAGGEPVRIGEVADRAWNLGGVLWHPDGRIRVLGSLAVYSIPATGGEATVLRAAEPETRGRLSEPSLAPDGRILVNAHFRGQVRLALLSADGKQLDDLPRDVSGPGWFVDDVLVFRRGAQLFAGRLDLDALTLIGDPVPASGIPAEAYLGVGSTVAWVDPVAERRVQPAWVTRAGVAAPLSLRVSAYRWPRLSPDGRSLAVQTDNGISVIDLKSGVVQPVAPTGGEPAWTRDGARVLLSATNGIGLVMWRPDGSQRADTVLRVPQGDEAWPTDVAPGDSLALYYGRPATESAHDLFVTNLRSRAIQRMTYRGDQRGGRFSPDGRWLAYQSTENGQLQVIVRPWPSLTERYVVSPEGGDEPSWSHDGRELFFRSGDRMMAVRVTAGNSFEASPPVELFRGLYSRDLWGDQSYDVAPDGRFFMLQQAGDSRVRVHVIHNWATELRRQLSEANR